MQKDELRNIIHALRRKGWTDTEIVNHLLEVEGEKPESKKE